MNYRQLTGTDLRISVLGFGAAGLGEVYRRMSKQDGVALVHEAFERGINYFDVSPYYGSTKAEAALGEALRGLPRDRIVVSTKVGRYGFRSFDFSRDRIVGSVDESLARLGLRRLDLVLCHDIEFGDMEQIVSESIPALRELQARGLVRYVGASAYPLPVLMELARRTPIDVVLSYSHCSLQNTQLEAQLPELTSRGIGVINASPFAMGLLGDDGPPDWHPAPAELRESCRRVRQYCQERGVSIAELAIQRATLDPRIATTLSTMHTQDELDRNIRAVEARVDPALFEEVRRLFGSAYDATWFEAGRHESSPHLTQRGQ